MKDMAFIQPCFIRKNTPYLRRKLEELGYKPFGSVKYEWYTGWGLSTDNRLGEFESFDDNGLENIKKCGPPDYEDSIDCGDNEDLFLALAALRDDTDEKQWFIMDYGFQKTWVFSETKQFDTNQPFTIKVYKATVEEIVEHFKK